MNLGNRVVINVLSLLKGEKFGKNKKGLKLLYTDKFEKISGGRMGGLIDILNEIGLIYYNKETKNYQITEIGSKVLESKKELDEIIKNGLEK